MIVLYLVIVTKTRVNRLRSKGHWYYTILGSITCVFTVLPAIFGKYGAQGGQCYITGPPAWKLTLGYSHLTIGMFIFLVFAFPVIRALYHLQHDVLQDVMYQQIFQAVFLFVLYAFSSLFLMNATLMEVWDGVFESKYIASTMYTYCISTIRMNELTGIVIGLIHLISYSSVKKFINKEKDQDTNCFKRLMNRIKRRNPTNTASSDEIQLNEYVAVATPTGAAPGPTRESQSMGCTAVSIPPDSQQKKAHFQAMRAYTTNLLLHAREELEEGDADSSLTEPSSSTDTVVEIESESDARLLAARERWHEECRASNNDYCNF